MKTFTLEEQKQAYLKLPELTQEELANINIGQVVVDLGKKYKFQIISIEAENHRLGLSLKVGKSKGTEKSDSEEVSNSAKASLDKKGESVESEDAPKKAAKARKTKKVTE